MTSQRMILCVLAASLLVASAAAAEEPIVPPINDIARGQKGYGLSVFAGNEPERFDVEVIGVMHNNTTELSYILARLSGQDLEENGVSAGMSGSPVYIDGRLVGAVSFSYMFSQGAIAGITPIEGMRKLDQASAVRVPVTTGDAEPAAASIATASSDLPARLPAWAVPDLDRLIAQDFDDSQLDRALAGLRPSLGSGQGAAIAWQAVGFGDAAAARLERAVGSLITSGGISAGSGADHAERPVAAGDAVAMLLVDGDLSLAAHGTITEVEGDRILAFGHPVFGLGPALVPMARSEVLTVIDSVASSFKLSNAGAIVGAFDQDREAGARGMLGEQAPMIPLRVTLRGSETRDYRMRIADLPPLLPTLVSLTTYGALNAGSYTLGEMGMDLEARLDIAGKGELELRQSFDGERAAIDAILYLLSTVGYLVGNDLETASLLAIDVTFDQSSRPRGATILAGHADRTRVAPGDTVAVSLELKSFRGPTSRLEVPVRIPDDVADGTYYLFLGDGVSIDGALASARPESPRSLEESMALLGRLRSRKDLAILGLVAGAGLAVGGGSMPALPDSMRTLIAGGGQPTTSLSLVVAANETRPQAMPIDGYARIDFEVRRRRP